jgi:tetratricopeptide (TPR) repeat protein
VQAEYQRARELAEEVLSLAQQTEDPLLVALGHWYLGFIWFSLGDYTTSRAHMKHVIDFYSPEQHHRPLVLLRGSDAGISALSYDACCLWCLGFPDQARLPWLESSITPSRWLMPFAMLVALLMRCVVMRRHSGIMQLS